MEHWRRLGRAKHNILDETRLMILMIWPAERIWADILVIFIFHDQKIPPVGGGMPGGSRGSSRQQESFEGAGREFGYFPIDFECF